MCTDSSITDLVTRARNGDKQGWDALVERYAPLVWSICRRHQLTDAEASNVGGTVWLQMADQLDRLPAPTALPGWLATAAVRECRRAQHAGHRMPSAGQLLDAETLPDEQDGVAEHELLVAEHELLVAEQHAALREAFAGLPPSCQQLILVLTEDPPMTPSRSVPGWASPSTASASPGAAAWISCATIRPMRITRTMQVLRRSAGHPR